MDIVTKEDAIKRGLKRYFTGIPCKYGHVAERRVSSGSCIECDNLGSRKWSEKNPTYIHDYNIENRTKVQELGRKWRIKNPDKVREYNLTPYGRVISQLNQAKRRAKSKGIEFSLTREDIIIPDVCPVLGIPLDRSPGVRNDNSPSLDRIDNSKGYTVDNICIISWKANRLKSNATIEDLKAIVAYMEQHQQCHTK